MRRTLALVLILITLMTCSAYACEECEGGETWETGDILVVSNCREWVSLRRSASTKAGRLAKVPVHEWVYFLSDADNGFAHVYWDGQYGYIHSDYLVYDGITVRFVTGCEEWISLRKEATTKAERLKKIPLGSMVYVTDVAGSRFAHVNYGDEAGYVLKEYLSDTPYSKGDTLRVANCEEWITLRAEPSTDAASRARLPLGSAVTVVSAAENGYIAVRCGNLQGYVMAGYLTK